MKGRARRKAIGLGLCFAALALALGLELRHWQSFRLHTDSMAPLFRAAPGGGDLVLWRASAQRPKRFDAVVARHPNAPGVPILKRVIGFGGERIALAGGDAWILQSGSDEPLRDLFERGLAAPLRMHQALADELFESQVLLDHPAGTHIETSDLDRWFTSAEPPGRALTDPSGALRIDADPSWQAELAVRAVDSSGSERDPRSEPVPDLDVRLTVEPERTGGRLTLAVFDPWRRREIRAHFAVLGATEPTQLELDAKILGRSKETLRAGRRAEIGLRAHDGRFHLAIDGQDLLVRDAPMPPGDEPIGPVRVRIEIQDSPVLLHGLRLRRDLHWRAFPSADFDVPSESYLLLGDAKDSVDARHWERVVVRTAEGRELLGDAHAIRLDLSAQRDQNPWRTEDGRYRFQDLAGTEHDLGPLGAFTVVGRAKTPFVRAQDLQGIARVRFRGAWPGLLP